MRILLSGYHNPRYVTVTEYIERALRSLGHELIIFNDRNHIFPGRLRKMVGMLQTISVSAINLKLVRQAERACPDIAIITGGHRINRWALRRLAQDQIRTVLWTIDAPRTSDIMPTTAGDYRHVFCQGTEYVDILREMGVADAHWLPMGCDPRIHRQVDVSPEERLQWGSPVAFVGSFYPCRADVLEKALRHELAIWGPGWEVLPFDSPLRACIRNAHTPPDIWTKIYSASNIVLSIHYRDPQNHFRVHQASPRVFEAMACGAFVLTDRQKDVLSLFKDGEHLVSFSDTADLDRKIAYFLKHADERREIAAAGKREVLRNHTYEHRMRQLLSRIGAPVTPPALAGGTASPSNAHPFAS
jgi:spore maturation protein CgeB